VKSDLLQGFYLGDLLVEPPKVREMERDGQLARHSDGLASIKFDLVWQI
jgi:hypothetical protein